MIKGFAYNGDVFKSESGGGIKSSKYISTGDKYGYFMELANGIKVFIGNILLNWNSATISKDDYSGFYIANINFSIDGIGFTKRNTSEQEGGVILAQNGLFASGYCQVNFYNMSGTYHAYKNTSSKSSIQNWLSTIIIEFA